jgi:hypothetical protein
LVLLLLLLLLLPPALLRSSQQSVHSGLLVLVLWWRWPAGALWRAGGQLETAPLGGAAVHVHVKQGLRVVLLLHAQVAAPP